MFVGSVIVVGYIVKMLFFVRCSVKMKPLEARRERAREGTTTNTRVAVRQAVIEPLRSMHQPECLRPFD